MIASGPIYPTARQLAASAVPQNLTGTTNETVLATVSVPAGAMGANGALHVITTWSFTGSTNAKTMRARLGGIGGTQHLGQSVSSATNVVLSDERRIRNRNSAASQVCSTNAGATAYGTTTAAVTTSTIDTSVGVDLVFTGQLALAGETITLETYEVWLIPSP